jgi:hypothetical protein
MIGTKIQKPIKDNFYYATVAKWCDENNAHIEDKGEYYEVVRNSEPTADEQIAVLEKQIEKINIDMLRDILIIDDDEQTTERKEEAKRYLAQKKIQKNDLIEKINKLREV